MKPGQEGPAHALDKEQVWTVLEGAAMIEIGSEHVRVQRGDTVVIPAGIKRRVEAGLHAGFAAIGVAPSGTGAYTVDSSAVGQCVIPEDNRLIPAWMA